MSSPGSSPPPQREEAPDSSPLLFPSSSPRSQSRRSSQSDNEISERTGRIRIEGSEVSSPLRYSSSPSRGARTPRGHSSLLFSDLDRETASARRNGAAQRRGDIFSSDITTPSKRYAREHMSEDAMSLSAREPTSEGANEPVRVIWGTNVSIQESMSSFRDFLQNFKSKYRMVYDQEPVLTGEGEDLVYVEMLQQMRLLGLSNLNLDAVNLLAYPGTRKLYHQLINYPQEIIPLMDQALKECLIATVSNEKSPNMARELDEVETRIYKVRPYGLQMKKGLRELNPGDIDKLVSVKGLVIRASPVIPDMKEAFFKCSVCNHTIVVEIDRGTITEPTKCPRKVCGRQNSMQIVHNRSTFADKQVVRLQETPDVTPDGQTPHSVSLCVYDELMDVCKAGDRVEVTGIFRSVPVRVNPRQRTLKSLYKTYVDIVHIQKVDKRRMGADVTTLEVQAGEQQEEQQNADVEETRRITDEEIAKIKEIAARPDVYELLARSLAPSIYEQDDVKKGVLLQLFGGTNKTFEKGGSPRYRGDINVLLCGDPSTSKSQLLQYVHKIAPRGIYTSGKGSSAVGLTAYVTRDIETRQLVLESGALVLSDGGVCCIDEFDKMSDATRAVLHEVMEQQTISVAKAGIITTLNARTSILASANPIGSRYDPTLSVPQNIDLPPSLLSRFDLVYLMLDNVDPQADRRLANHLARMYVEDAPENNAAHEVVPVELLTLYISYAKQNIHPEITPEAKQELVKEYVKMRRLGEDARSAEKRITATTRQLESMIRLSEAHAKMRLSEDVTVEDVHEAVELMKRAIKDYATDPITGQIDMDLVSTGTSTAQRQKLARLKDQILGLLDSDSGPVGAPVPVGDIHRRFVEELQRGVSEVELLTALKSLEEEGRVKLEGTGPRRRVRRVPNQF